MTISRRKFTLGAVAGTAWLAGCSAGPGPQRAASVPAVRSALRRAPNAQYDAYLAGFKQQLQQEGFGADLVSSVFRNAGFMPGVIELDRNQAEFQRPLVDYLALVAPEEKIIPGRRAFAKYRGQLARIEAEFGVPAHVLGGVWGAESSFGTRMGDFPIISATSTLAFEGRRRRFFEAQLREAVRIVQAGDAQPHQMLGSWAGAMGHTQMIPTAFREHRTDFNGDGRFDVFGADPTDALAATARFLARAGWRRGHDWGLEVTAPPGAAGNNSVAVWQNMGVRAAQGGALPDYGSARILRPSGASGPVFLVFGNFDKLMRYNPSQNYALAVGYLAGRLQGNGPLRTAFPPDQYGFSLQDRQELQRLLKKRGFDPGTPDGVLGKKTETAISEYQKARRLPVTGQPSRALLNGLR